MKKDGGARVATYTYDALGRRIRKVVSGGDLPDDEDFDGTTDYRYASDRRVEERNPFDGAQEDEDTLIRQYVWGFYADELIQQESCGMDRVFS